MKKCTDPPQESIGAGRELQGLVRALDAGEHDTVDSIAHLSCRRQCKMGAVTDAPEVQFGGVDLLTQDLEIGCALHGGVSGQVDDLALRSGERRGGTERVSTCRYVCSP